METSSYRFTFERKMNEVFEALEVDPKRALRTIQKEIEQRQSKISPSALATLKVVKASVLDRNNRAQEARDEIFGVLDEVNNAPEADMYLLDTIQRTIRSMKDSNLFTARYLETVETLQGKNPDEKELAFMLYEGSLQNNKFAKAAKMAAKMNQQFGEPSFALPQVQCLYMDSQKWLGGSQSPISLQLAVAFAEKYMKTNQERNEDDEPIPVNFCKLYLKLLLAQKAFDKAQAFLDGAASRSFELWVEKRTWQLRILFEAGQEDRALDEMLEMIKFNYTQVEQDFQSIYNLHEVMLSMAVSRLTSVKAKSLTLDQIKSLMSQTEISEEALFPNFDNQDSFIKALNASFSHYANSFAGVKSVNALNCRKSALLSMMLLRHKLVTLSGLKPSKEESTALYKDLIVQYSKVFISVQTLVFDLAPYLGNLSECLGLKDVAPAELPASDLLAMFTSEAEAVGDDQVRKARVLLNKAKMESMLGHARTVADAERMLKQYLEFRTLDGKPEKGERKIADDFILLFDEVLEHSVGTEVRTDGHISELDLMRIGVLEYALAQSPYNFDIQMALVKIYDSHGLCVQFRQALEGIGIKGVQQESMGFLQLRHSLEWGQLEQLFKPNYAKYVKYGQFNERDLQQLKHKSFQADNWEQVENFIEYEAFLKRSYFEKLSQLFNRLHDQTKASAGTPDATKECFEGTAEQVKQEAQSEAFTRTQDIKVVLPKFSIAQNGQIMAETRPVGHDEHTFLDRLNRILIQDDPLYSVHKSERQSNFKPHVVNTLGLFENEAIYKKVMTLFSLVSTMYAGQALQIAADPAEESKEPELQLALSQATFAAEEMAAFDYAGSDQTKIATKLGSFNQVLENVFKTYTALNSVEKRDGQPGNETAAQIMAKTKPAFEQLLGAIEALSQVRASAADSEGTKVVSQLGLKWFFVEMTLLGAVIVPAFDALCLKLKNTVPSFKKKKGAALPAEVGEVQQAIWIATKTALKQLQTSIESQSSMIEAALRESFAENEVLSVCDNISLPQGCSEEDQESLRKILREKASEFASEKAATSQRVAQQAQLVCKQLKAVMDVRFK